MGVGKELWYELLAGYNRHDSEGAASLYASDGVYTDPNGRCEGRQAIRAFLEAGDKALPDGMMRTVLVIEEGDVVVAEWTYTGTFTAAMVMPDGTEIPATGKTVEAPGVSVITVRDGKLTNHRDYFDSVTWNTQLGLMPST